MHLDEWHQRSGWCSRETSKSTFTGVTPTIWNRCTFNNTSAISFMVLGVPAGKNPRRSTSEATSRREHQHHTVWLHLLCTTLMYPHNVLADNKPLQFLQPSRRSRLPLDYVQQYHFQKGLHSTSSSVTTSLDRQARFHQEHLTIGCRDIAHAAGQHRGGRPQPPYKSIASLFTSVSREGGKIPQQPLWTTSVNKSSMESWPQLPLQHRWFGEYVLGDIRNIPRQKLRLRNQHQKLRGIWLGRDLVLFRGVVFHRGGVPENCPLVVGRLPSLMGRFPTAVSPNASIGRFPLLKTPWKTAH